jgi:hypothetical protein
VPDRRAGLTLDMDFGVARIAGGVYQGAHRLDVDALGGVLLAARLVVEPFGPVGRTPWPTTAPGPWTARPRVAFGASGAFRDDSVGSGWMIGGDVAFTIGRFLVDGEVLYARRWPLERAAPFGTSARADRLGAWLEQVVVAWRSRIGLALREEYDDEGVLPHRVALGGGVTLDLAHRVRLQAAYLEALPLVGASVVGAHGVLLADLTIMR